MIWKILEANREIDRLTAEVATLKEGIEAQTKAIEVLAEENGKLKGDLTLVLDKLTLSEKKVSETENLHKLAGQKALEIAAQQGIPPILDKPKGEQSKELHGRDRVAAAIKAELNGRQ